MEVKMLAVKRYIHCGILQVPKYAIERAVRNLDKIEALALIRAAYGDKYQPAPLEEAVEIYTSIMAEREAE